MKIVIIALICLAIGYAGAIYFPVGSIEKAATNLASDAAEVSEISEAAGVNPETSNGADAPSDSSSTSEVEIDESFLQETDLLNDPGLDQLIAYRIGMPMSSQQADDIVKKLPVGLYSAKARFYTATGQKAVIVLAGKYLDQDQAELQRNILESIIELRVKMVYLPKCAEISEPDDEGFVCGVAEPSEVAAD